MEWITLLLPILLELFDRCQENRSPQERLEALRGMGRFRLAAGVRRALRECDECSGLSRRAFNKAAREATNELVSNLASATDAELMGVCEESVGAAG